MPARVGTGTGVTPMNTDIQKCVTLAKAEVQEMAWIPASAGMTRK